MKNPLLHLQSVGKTFAGEHPLEILKGVNIQVFENETSAIVGDSGVGKSTLLHIAGLLEQPSSGEIFYSGLSFRNTSCDRLRREKLGFIFQGFYLIEEESALSNVLMPATIARRPTHSSSPSYERAMQLLSDVGLLERAHFPAKLLSGGEKQRVAIARAFCNDPSLILADEPTGNLDQGNSEKVQEILLSCCKKHGKSLLLVTHDNQFAEACDNRYLLTDKMLVKQ